MPAKPVPGYNPRLVALGLLAGAMLGLVWASTRQRHYARYGPPRLLDWDRVRRVALQIIKEEPVPQGWHRSWVAYYRDMVQRCYPVISAEIGRELPVPLDHIQAFTRTEWIDANIANFKMLFDRIEDIYQKAQKQGGLGAMLLGDLSQTVLSSQLGILMGYLARRVLGQYDLSLLGKEPVTTGRLYFVEPNIGAVQNELQLHPDDFRLWIALHETTHAYEFEAYPWVREYFNSLLEQYFSYLTDDLMTFGSNLGGLWGLVERARTNIAGGESWVEAVMTPEQRALFARLQALMSIVEGYSNYIMNSVGQRLLPTYATIKERVEQRAARRSPAEKLFVRITGLALKMEQYKLGESFITEVVQHRGVEFVNRLWEGPDMLPTLDELRNPQAWVRRVA